MSKLIVILLAGISSCILFMILHAFPWGRIFGKHPKPPWTYVAGILGLGIVFTAAMAYWRDWWALGTAVSTVVGAGGAVIFGYKVRGQGPILMEDTGQQEEIICILRDQVAELERKLIALEERGKCPKKVGGHLET